jgi:cell wall-associated NlpC family hydrolase
VLPLIMSLRKLFPRVPLVLVACIAIGICSTSAFAQTRLRVVSGSSDPDEVSCSPDDLNVTALAPVADSKPVWEAKPKPTIDLNKSASPTTTGFLKVQPLLLAAIDERLGSRYRWGATGPNRFDCSGFVWSIFQAAGISFDRSNARTLFGMFSAPAPEDQFKFGTLVFFSRLTHVGVVADEHGFYHASRRHGVVYQPFNDYWLKHIDGFRRVPTPAAQLTD